MNAATEKLLALTFDDGPNTGTMVSLLELLDRQGAKATFFVVGNCISEETAQVLRGAVARGHEIGNHSESHLHMTQLPEARILQEVRSVQDRVRSAAGVTPVLFRPPYIDVDEKLLQTVPMPCVSGASNRDWDPDCSVEERLETALRDARDGAILLMHCFPGNDATLEVLERLLPQLRQAGFRMVTVSSLFAEKGIPLERGKLYESAGSP